MVRSVDETEASFIRTGVTLQKQVYYSLDHPVERFSYTSNNRFLLKAGAEHTTLLPSDYSFDIWRFVDAKDSFFRYPYKTSLK